MKTKKSRERNRRLRRSIWWWRGREKEKAATAAAVDTQTEKRKEGFGIFSSRLLLPFASKKGRVRPTHKFPEKPRRRRKKDIVFVISATREEGEVRYVPCQKERLFCHFSFLLLPFTR